MSEEKPVLPTKPAIELRLIFQGSIPVETIEHAESWYKMLKEMVKSQSLKSTINGQIIKSLESCCGERKP